MGVELLRQHNQANHAPFVQKRTSPFVATLLSAICPGLGAAYNGQSVKALVYFGVFIGLFQMALITGTALFVLGFMGMWFFAALDAWRTAQMIRSGVTPDMAEDILVKRFSGNPKLWGIVLTALGAAFLLQTVFPVRGLIRGLIPLMLIGLGIYVLRGYIFKAKPETDGWDAAAVPQASFALTQSRYNEADYSVSSVDLTDRTRSSGWKDA